MKPVYGMHELFVCNPGDGDDLVPRVCGSGLGLDKNYCDLVFNLEERILNSVRTC